jgi:hypothetical protein
LGILDFISINIQVSRWQAKQVKSRNKVYKLIKRLSPLHIITGVILLAGSLLLGILIPVMLGVSNNGSGWMVSSLILFLSALILYGSWSLFGRDKILAWMISFAFLLRIGIGIVTEATLPVWGYEEPVQKSGYLFYDAYKRDNDAWALAKSTQPIWAAFENEFVGDQYGGLLSISALVYRNLSSDQHRPYLIMLLTALAGALAVPFIHAGAKKRWGERVALYAAGLVAFFPDSVLFGASQMREPFLVLFIAVALWGIVDWKDHKRYAIAAIILSALGLFLTSYRIAVPALAVLVGWFLLDNLPRKGNRRSETITWVGILIAAMVMAVLSWGWLQSSSNWDILETIRTSGRVQYVFESVPEKFKVPFIIGYGLTQPVLPAAIVDPALPIWHSIAILRGIGWYAIAPLLIYAFLASFKVKDPMDRRILVWMSICMLIWLLISSARAGGDQWDNPRYRSIFLVYFALLCGWAWDYARKNKDAWLGRFYVIEGIFLGFFLEWYISRYYQIIGRLQFEKMLLVVAGLSIAVILGGVVWDKINKKRHSGNLKGS